MTVTPDLPRIDAASLVAMPAFSPSPVQLARSVAAARRLCEHALGGDAYLSHVWESDYGRLGGVFIPVVDVSLFDSKQETVAAALKGVELAARLGARCVSFTGMIPAATDYARDIVRAVRERVGAHPGLADLRLTTGHATVVAAFALNIERLLAHAGRAYPDERVAFVGLGSIGEGILRLLSARPPPRHTYLVDVTRKRRHLDRLKADLARTRGGAPGIDVVTVGEDQGVPDALYADTTLFLSATSTAGIIDIDKLVPGTLMVDDSFPLGFDAGKAVARMEGAGDILITIAGGFQGPSDFRLRYARADTGDAGFDALLNAFPRIANPWPDCMTGCVYSALLTPHFGLPDTVGPVALADAARCYQTLRDAGFCGTPPYFITFGSDRTGPIFVPEGEGLRGFAPA